MEDGFEGLGEDRKQALKEALKKEWISSPVYKLPERKVKKQRLLSSDDWNAIAVLCGCSGCCGHSDTVNLRNFGRALPLAQRRSPGL